MENSKMKYKYCCSSCDYFAIYKKDIIKHITTQKHKKNIYENNNNIEIEIESLETKKEQYHCLHCEYNTFSKSDFIKHENTNKHKKMVKKEEDTINICSTCNKNFVSSSGLWKHTQKCKSKQNNDVENDSEHIPTSLITTILMELVKSNKNLQDCFVEQNNTNLENNNKLIELVKSNNHMVYNSNSNNNFNNTTNNQFNLNFFLNETCKDAMSINDFVNSLKVSIEDFETTGQLGYIEGISRIIINGLKSIDTTKRPIHCTDVKRETVYIKHEGSWEKEEPEQENLKSAVNKVARMNLCQLPKWQSLNPESAIIDTKQNEEYVQYSMAALGAVGNDKEESKMMDKIVKNVLKEVIVDKKIQGTYGSLQSN